MRIYRAQFKRMLGLRSYSRKLVCFCLVNSQPQSFTTMRKSLGSGKATLSRALESLRRWRLVAREERFLYWTEQQDDR